MITPQQFRNPQVKPKWQLPVGAMESIVAYNCRKYGMPRPVLAMPMWEGAGNRALDYSGHGNHGDIIGAGWVANGLDFDGVIGTHIDLPNSMAGMIHTQGTISVCIEANAIPAGLSIIFSNHEDSAWGDRLFLGVGSSDNIYLRLGDMASTYVSSISTGIKYHIVLVWGTGASGNYTVYLDGNSVANGAYTGLDTLGPYSTIGSLWHHDTTDYKENFNGLIDKFSIFHAILSPAQVRFLHDNPYFMYEIPEELYGYAAAVGDTATNLLHGKIIIKDSSIILVDGLVKVQDSVTDLFDGELKVIETVTSLADGKLLVQDTTVEHTFDTKNRVTGTSNPLVVPITPTTGATVLVLGIVCDGAISRIGGTPTYNGDDMTYITGANAIETNVEMWYILNPDIGTYNVSIPNTQPEDLWAVVSVFKASSGYTSELDVSNSDDAVGANPSVTVTTTEDGDVIVDVMGSGHYEIPTDNSDILLYSAAVASHCDNHQYALDETAGERTLSWTQTGDDWCMAVAAFKLVSTSETSSNVFDGQVKVIESVTSNTDGKIQVKDSATSLADGKVQIKDVIASQADGKVKVLDVATSVADGKVKVLDVDTDIADGKIQIKDIATNLADGRIKITEYVTDIADGKITVKDVYTDITDGLVQIKDSTTNLLDGKVRIKFIATNLADGKIKVRNATTGLVDGLIKVQEKVTSLVDGKVKIKDKATELADGLVEVVGSTTSNVDGKVIIKDIATTITDGKVKIIEKITSTVDGKVIIKSATTGIADGKIIVKDAVTGLADGLVKIKDSTINLLDGKVKISNLATSLADAKIKIKDTVTDLLDGKVTITGLITGHPWFYRRKQ